MIKLRHSGKGQVWITKRIKRSSGYIEEKRKKFAILSSRVGKSLRGIVGAGAKAGKGEKMGKEARGERDKAYSRCAAGRCESCFSSLERLVRTGDECERNCGLGDGI